MLYVDSGGAEEQSAGDVLALLVRHDLDDVRSLLSAATGLTDADYRKQRLPDHVVLEWHGPEESIADVLTTLVRSKLPWLATIEGSTAPATDAPDDVAHLALEHDEIAARWLAMIRGVERRGAWADLVIDALCEPPESFLMSQIVAHELTFSAHRRQLMRWMLNDAGVVRTTALDPDPIMWHRATWQPPTPTNRDGEP
ncbi:hypothetical protein [Nocardioides alcanivorans]|uniref:hypothetical protein n=1 Tax=Nocardioides alcanivorans TaxID=2897352 RepID=UPI001F41F54A|nr:hypothetical protein [Nocardioides alcanivorans]